jgi:hypothetical protein
VGSDYIIHCQGPRITAFSGIYHFYITLTLFADLHPVDVVTLTVEVAKIFLFFVTTKWTTQTG